MKIHDGRITILVEHEYTTIRLHDGDSSTTFAEAKLTPEQLSQALSRLSMTKCEIELHGLDRIGKVHENSNFTFAITEEHRKDRTLLYDACLLALKKEGMEDWTPDNYWGRQSTFSKKDGVTYATATIRRWVEKPKQ